jgi:3-ketosteroid 9alpha-monooxygenase subunit B
MPRLIISRGGPDVSEKPMPPIPPPPPLPPGMNVGVPMAAPPSPPIGMPSLSSLPPVTAPVQTAAVPQRGIRKMEAVVVDVVRRTHDSASIYFFLGGDYASSYKAGQFVSIDPHQFPELKRWTDFLERDKGKKEPIRAYSMQSAPGEKCVSICVKAEGFDPKHDKYPPLLSPFLVSGAIKGREIVISGFSGGYVLADDHAQKTDQVLHLVAGSGIVPNYALVKDELRKPQNAGVKHTMIYANKTYADIILREQLDALQKAFPERFELIHCISREDPSQYGPNYVKGRITLDVVKQHVRDPSSVLAFACGAAITKYQRQAAKAEGKEPTPRFMETVEEIVHALAIPKAHFKKEEFG